ncbi:PepSY domain-containing protein [Vibrio sp. OPT18]|uniref:PepSY domain-containing protein n=1 Tax=Vibrio sp. OPT18 TaxID=2778641 RepID=UPI001881FFEF|nr:PepSY domain-containing protein [Vibrio sp. OPT18]MBE8574513.1 PepSY domain-containing protein [Vibrio sp. OPT18]
MKQLILCGALVAVSTFSVSTYAAQGTEIISKEQAIKAALLSLDIEVLGIRHDEPDTQWDVFVMRDGKAYEIEVDAVTAKIVAVEEESLAEVQAELSGELSHEGVTGDVDK